MDETFVEVTKTKKDNFVEKKAIKLLKRTKKRM